jgi:hypothetical protein
MERQSNIKRIKTDIKLDNMNRSISKNEHINLFEEKEKRIDNDANLHFNIEDYKTISQSLTSNLIKPWYAKARKQEENRLTQKKRERKISKSKEKQNTIGKISKDYLKLLKNEIKNEEKLEKFNKN